jgi:iron complex transport system ATP-binding protein
MPFPTPFPFPGVTATLDDEALILRSESRLSILSSAVVGGGFLIADAIINRHVSKHYDHPHPGDDLLAFAWQRGVNGPFAGLMTAVYLRNTRVVALAEENVRLTLVMTAGFSNATAAGLSPSVTLRPGTINLIFLIDAMLSPAAMVNAVITATEAKTHTLREWGLQTPDGLPATGTSTDAIVVACTDRGPRFDYAGPVTPVGRLMARAVRQGLETAQP